MLYAARGILGATVLVPMGLDDKYLGLRRRVLIPWMICWLKPQGWNVAKKSNSLDEVLAAYKPIEQVMINQADLVEIVATLKQVLCVKG